MNVCGKFHKNPSTKRYCKKQVLTNGRLLLVT